jgi:hypothetical protein
MKKNIHFLLLVILPTSEGKENNNSTKSPNRIENYKELSFVDKIRNDSRG